MKNISQKEQMQSTTAPRQGAVTATPVRGAVIRDICAKLSREGAVVEITRAARYTKNFKDNTEFFSELTPDKYERAVRDTRNVAFLAGVSGAIKSKRATNANVPMRNHIVFDCDLKDEYGDEFLLLPANEKKQRVIEFWERVSDAVTDAFGDPWLVVYSGKGLHVHYFCSRALATTPDSGYLAFYDRALASLLQITNVKWDEKCKNPARLIRMPYSTNTFESETLAIKQELQTDVIYHNPDCDNSDLFGQMLNTAKQAIERKDRVIESAQARQEMIAREITKATGAVMVTDPKGIWYLKERVKRELTFDLCLHAFSFEMPKQGATMINAPWRTDNTPSVWISEENKCFKDHGSEKHKGDILDFLGFLMGIENPRHHMKRVVEYGAAILGYPDLDCRPVDYYLMFATHLKNVRRDLVTDVLMHEVEGKWKPVENDINWLRGHADDGTKYLDPSKVAFHLAHYIGMIKPRLLIDIPEWDGIDRIKQIANCLTAQNLDQEMIEEIIKEWGAILFERIENPHVQNTMLILTGKQGAGKGELVKSLVGAFGRYYGVGALATNDKDDDIRLSEKLVWYIDEYDSTRRIDVARLKTIITREEVTIRLPYDRRSTTLPCRYSMLASCNPREVLRDSTGNRRYRVIELTDIDWSYPRDQSPQILAQFKTMKSYRVSDRTLAAINEYNDAHTPASIESQIVALFDEYMIGNGQAQLDGYFATNMRQHIARSLGTTDRRINEVLKQAGRCKLHRNKFLRYELPPEITAN